MNTSHSARIWPAWLIVAAAATMLIVQLNPEIQNLTRFLVMMAGPLACAVAMLIWLFFFSRLSRGEALAICLSGIGSAGLATLMAQKKVGVGIWIYGLPLGLFAVTLAVTLLRKPFIGRAKWLAIAAGTTWFVFPLLRSEGVDGGYVSQFAWRWSQSDEERLLAKTADLPVAAHFAAVPLGALTWPGFRGPQADGLVSAAVLPNEPKPRIVWKTECGPGWSSFAVSGQRLFTQEQRGTDECVTCYSAADGRLIWKTGIQSRFDEVVSGPGPRATPTLVAGANGIVELYAFTSRGTLLALDAASGTVRWKRDFAAEVNAKVPMWACSGSPVCCGENVLVYVDGDDGNGLVAVSRDDGKTVWKLPISGQSYATVQPVNIDGQSLALFASEKGWHLLDPFAGKELTLYVPDGMQPPEMVMVQPRQLNGTDFILPVGDGKGIARVKFTRNNDATWRSETVWFSRDLKPSFNDFVYDRQSDCLYGFDQHMLACVSAVDGKRKWKQGRYGFGQLIGFPDSRRLIVLGEYGQLVPLALSPERGKDPDKFTAIEGKTWNHPVWADNRLFVRNGREIACVVFE